MRPSVFTAVAMAAVLVASGCRGGGADRQDVLVNLADDVIVPAAEALELEATQLAAATTKLCQEPSTAALEAARVAVADTRAAWSLTEPMWVGPVMERRSWAVIDWHIVAEEIEELIADTSVALDNDRLARRIGADQRGLGAVEYILGAPTEGQSVLEQLGDQRRCEYLTGIVEVIADETALLPTAWTVDFEDGGPYRERFSSVDGSGLDTIVNDTLFLLEAIADAELGTALGEMDGEADLDAIVEGPAGLATSDLARHLAGLRIVLIGDDTTPGLRPLLGDDLGSRLAQQFDDAQQAVDEIDQPLREAVTVTPAAVSEARQGIKAIQVTVATEVVSRLGVTIGFSDADGDTGA